MQTTEVDIKKMDEVIQELRQKAEYLKEISGSMQCVDRNCDRILASVKMLELNISDVLEFVEE